MRSDDKAMEGQWSDREGELLELFELCFAKVGLTQYASQGSGGYVTMLRDGGRKCSCACGLGELCMASRLTNQNESGRFKFAFDLPIKDWLHAALTSISSERIRGASVATGGVKCSSNAS